MAVYTLNNPFNDRRGSARGAYVRYKTILVLLSHATPIHRVFLFYPTFLNEAYFRSLLIIRRRPMDLE